MLRRLFPVVAAFAAVLATTGCTVQYRHEVEPEGTPTNWQYDAGRFIRYDGYSEGEEAVAGDMEIAITDYESEKEPGVVVRMVGVVHIADRDYYRQIQQALDEADLVLYEGVNREGKPGTVDPATRELWTVVSGLMGLAAQTSEIHYDREHFKQCDLVTDPEYQKEQGGAGLGLANPEAMGILRQIVEMKGQFGELADMQRMEDYVKHSQATQLLQFQGFSTEEIRDFIRQMRTVLEPLKEMSEQAGQLAELLKNLEEQLEKMETLIITERNEYVMKKLGEELAAQGGAEPGGTATKRVIAIFYGAGHMPDFDERLAKTGFERGDSRWLKAWKMNSR